MLCQLREGPLDGQELTVMETAFESGTPGYTGIRVTAPAVQVVNDEDHDDDFELPQMWGFYETPEPRMPGEVLVLTWSGWMA